MLRDAVVQKFLDVPEQMSAALLLAESRDQVPVGGVKIPDMFPHHCGRAVFVNMKENGKGAKLETLLPINGDWIG